MRVASAFNHLLLIDLGVRPTKILRIVWNRIKSWFRQLNSPSANHRSLLDRKVLVPLTSLSNTGVGFCVRLRCPEAHSYGVIRLSTAGYGLGRDAKLTAFCSRWCSVCQAESVPHLWVCVVVLGSMMTSAEADR